MTDNSGQLKEAIEVLKEAKYIGSDKYATDYDKRMNEAIDTVVAELEKELPLKTKLEMFYDFLYERDIANQLGVGIDTVVQHFIDEKLSNKEQSQPLPTVSGSSLPLKIERVIVVAAQRWGKDYAGSTVGIIGRDAVEICEHYGIDWENYR